MPRQKHSRGKRTHRQQDASLSKHAARVARLGLPDASQQVARKVGARLTSLRRGGQQGPGGLKAQVSLRGVHKKPEVG